MVVIDSEGREHRYDGCHARAEHSFPGQLIIATGDRNDHWKPKEIWAPGTWLRVILPLGEDDEK